MNKQKSKIFSFSAKDSDLELILNFKESLGSYNFSEAMLDGVKCLLKGKQGHSEVELRFNEYCRKNHLSKDAQLELLMGPYRVSNNVEDDFSADVEVDFYATN